jgi:CP family cyanate transporter-like MFS transporter
MFTWLPTVLTDAGLGDAVAGAYLSLFAFVAIPIALVVPWLTVRLRRPVLLVFVFAAAYAVGYVGLLVAPTTATAVWVVAAGLGPGAFPLILTLVNIRTSTVSGAAALAGCTQGLGYGVAGLGPFVVGVLRDAFGSWRAPFTFLLAGLALQVVSGIVVSRARTLEEELAAPRRDLRRG